MYTRVPPLQSGQARWPLLRSTDDFTPSLLQIFVPRADTVSRLKLNKTDFDNHIFYQSGGEVSNTLVSNNGKVGCLLLVLCDESTSLCVDTNSLFL